MKEQVKVKGHEPLDMNSKHGTLNIKLDNEINQEAHKRKTWNTWHGHDTKLTKQNLKKTREKKMDIEHCCSKAVLQINEEKQQVHK